VGLRLVALLEAAGRLDHDVDSELAPGKIRGIGNRERPQAPLADADRLRVGLHLLAERAEQRVEGKQVRHRPRVAQVVDGDDLVVGAPLQIRAEEDSGRSARSR